MIDRLTECFQICSAVNFLSGSIFHMTTSPVSPLNWIVLTVILIRSSRSQLPVGIRAASLQQSKCMLMDNLSLSVLNHVEVFITATGNHPGAALVPLFCIQHSSKFPFLKILCFDINNVRGLCSDFITPLSH